MIREGSAARNLEALLPLVLQLGPGNCLLCTDDREPDELVAEGHINAVVRKAVALGCPPYHAIVMATMLAARYHRLDRYGAIAPGYVADLMAVPDLEEFPPSFVLKRGRVVAERGVAVPVPKATAPDWMRGSVHVPKLSAADFAVSANGRVRAIGVDAGQLVTRSLVVEPGRSNGDAVSDPSRDLAKVAVVERHKGTGRIGLGFVTGFGLQRGAFASTHAHDAHNVVVVGVDDSDMAAAVNHLASIGGGQVAVVGGLPVAEVPCPIGGLLSDQRVEEVSAAVRQMAKAAKGLGVRMPAPFMTLSFLALSVIPELKLTDRGLVDTVRFELVPLEV